MCFMSFGNQELWLFLLVVRSFSSYVYLSTTNVEQLGSITSLEVLKDQLVMNEFTCSCSFLARLLISDPWFGTFDVGCWIFDTWSSMHFWDVILALFLFICCIRFALSQIWSTLTEFIEKDNNNYIPTLFYQIHYEIYVNSAYVE